MTMTRLTAYLSVLVLAMPAGLAGQPAPTQTGHALDANPSVTGGPINQPAPSLLQVGPQYLMVGEGRLGRSFQGLVPYGSTGQFQGPLGSSTLYNFTRDSVGLPMVTQPAAGPVYMPQPFTTSSRSVFGAGQVTSSMFLGAGQTVTVLNPFARPSYLVADAPPSLVAGRWSEAVPPTFSAVQLPALPLSEQLGFRRQELARQADPGRRPQPTGVLIEPTPTDPSRKTGDEQAAPGPLGTELKHKPLGPVDPSLFKVAPDSGQPGPTEDRGEPAAGQTGQLGQPLQQHQLRRSPEPAEAQPWQPGQDLLSDLLKRAEEVSRRQPSGRPQGGGDAWLAGDAGPVAAEPQAPPIVPSGIAVPTVPAPPTGQPGQPEPAHLQPLLPGLVLDLDVRYDSFASSMPSEANVAISRAEQLIGQGRFYEALDQLTWARRQDPANPLVWLRACHAFTAAGEFFSAAGELRAAIRIFPSAASVRTDLAGLLGPQGASLLTDRLAELQRFAQRTDDPSLWMLLCYLQYTTGRTEQARRTAEHLLARAGSDSPATALARFVLDRASPATAPDR